MKKFFIVSAVTVVVFFVVRFVMKVIKDNKQIFVNDVECCIEE